MFDRYHEYESTLAAVQVLLVMLGMGATLSPADFAAVIRQPRSLVVGCVCQFLLAPLLTVATIRLCRLDDGVAVGLILVSSMPGGPLANFFTFLARGNVALSIALTGVATVASLASVPVLLQAFAGGVAALEQPMPAALIIGDVLLYLLAPLLAGMLLHRAAPEASLTFSKWAVRAALGVLICIVVGSLGSGRIEPLGYGWGTPAAIVVLCVAIQNLSMTPFAVLHWPVADQTAVGVGVTIRNINLALLLAARLFPATNPSDGGHTLGGGVLYVILFWGALSMVVCVPSIYFQRRALAAEALRMQRR